jgi:hypothetical protein
MSKKAAELAEQMAQMLEVIGTLEARITELKKMARKGARKGGGAKAVAVAKAKRPPTAWIQFTQRVRAALASAGQPFPRVADLMKFCKDLRIQKGEGCTDEEILALRDGWEAPTPVQSVGGDAAEAADAVAAPTCPTCSEEIGTEPEKHRACVRAVAAAAQAAGADPMKAVDAWSEAVQSGPRVAPLRENVAASRARTPLRRPSAPIHFNSAAEPAARAPAATLNTPSEEMVVEEV